TDVRLGRDSPSEAIQDFTCRHRAGGSGFFRTAIETHARWNARTPCCRVNIRKNARETMGLGAGSTVEDVQYCRIEKGLETPVPGAVTALLRAWGDGDDGALDQLTPLVEAELRRLARGYMRRERRGH